MNYSNSLASATCSQGGISPAPTRTIEGARALKLSIVMPIYNEEKTLAEIVERVQATPYEKELLLVNDCSSDGSSAIMAQLAEKYDNIRCFHHPKNLGKILGPTLDAELVADARQAVVIEIADGNHTELVRMSRIGLDMGAADSAADDRNILDHERCSPFAPSRSGCSDLDSSGPSFRNRYFAMQRHSGLHVKICRAT